MNWASNFLDPTGGFLYHYLAWKYKRKLWQPFTHSIDSWLNSWEQCSVKLLLVGPSAGYSIPPEFVYRYDEVTVIDKDPTSHFLFRRRFPQVKAQFTNANWLQRYGELLRLHKESDIVFCNILGQLPIGFPGWPTWKEQFVGQLSGKNWCSYHDIYSYRAKMRPIIHEKGFSKQVAAEELFHAFSTKYKMRGITVIDHMSSDLFPDGPRRVVHWQRTKEDHHFIEMVRSAETYPGSKKKSLLEVMISDSQN